MRPETKNVFLWAMFIIFIITALALFGGALYVVETEPMYGLTFLAIGYTLIVACISLVLYSWQDKKIDNNFKNLNDNIDKLYKKIEKLLKQSKKK